MTDRASENKALVQAMLAAIARAAPSDLPGVLRDYCHEEITWEVFHPFNTLRGIDEGAESFWSTLHHSFPDHEQRVNLLVAGEYAGTDWVSTLGHAMGTFASPWLGIPATQGLTYLRFGMHAAVREGRIETAYILLDVVDVMRQAGHYPFRRMPGSPEQWPAPPASAADPGNHDADLGQRTIDLVIEMQDGLGFGSDLFEIEHSPRWHTDMNWYGPCGIGSTRGQRGFDDYHGALFVQAFPDAADYSPETDGPSRTAHDTLRIGDGRYAVTGGWPSLIATHSGPGFLGLPPSNRTVTMRVADWYRTDADDLIVDNWVMIDIPHLLQQMGYDLLDDQRYLVDPQLPRWRHVVQAEADRRSRQQLPS